MLHTIQASIHTSIPTNIQTVHCPNCGSLAQREICTLDANPSGTTRASQTVVRTQCRTCDYLLVTSSDWVKVIESYAPGRTSNPSPGLADTGTHPEVPLAVDSRVMAAR